MKNGSVKKKNILKKQSGGFTLIELLAVISILAIVSVIVMFTSVNVVGSAKEKSYAVTVNNIEKEAGNYAIENQANLAWQYVDGTNQSKQYFCVKVRDLIDTGYFKSDVLDSYVKEDRKVTGDDYIFLERDTSTKTVTKNILLASVADDYENLCGDINTGGNISFKTEPSGWTKEKVVTISYEILNYDNLADYNYYYEYTDEDGNDTDIKDSNEFSKSRVTEEVTIDEPGTLNAKIIDDEDNLIVTKSLNIGKIDRNGPEIEILIDDGTTYSKSKEAIIRLKDSESGFKAGNYNVKYDWSTNELSCGDLSKKATITIASNNALSGEVRVSVSGGTGVGKLYVCGDNVSDYVGNEMGDEVVSKEAYLDNIGPEIALANDETKEVRGSVTIPLNVTDDHSGVDGSSFITSDVSVSIGSSTLTSGVTLTKEDDNNYNLKIENYNYAGVVKITIGENNVLDKAGNGNEEKEITTKITFKNTYTITYDANGGTGSMSSTTCTYGSSCTLRENTFERTGYTFLGWSKDSGAVNATYSDKYVYSTFNETSDIKLYAVWKADVYAVVLNADLDGTIPTTTGWTAVRTGVVSKSVTYGSTYGTLTTPTKSGYTFTGWYDTTQATTLSSSAGTNNYSAVRFLSNVYPGLTYKITMDSATLNSGTATTFTTLIFDYTDGVTVATATNQSLGSNLSYTIACPSSVDSSHDLVILAYLGVAGSTSGNSITFKNVKITTVSSSTSTAYTSSSIVTAIADHSLFAHWTANTYTITYNANGGTGNMSSTACTYGVNCTLSANTFTRTRYTFLGWSESSTATSATYSDKYIFSPYNVADNKTLYAVWKANQVIIKFNVNSGTVKSSTTSSDGVTYSWSSDSSGIVYKDGSVYTQKFDYGGSTTSDGIANYNNGNYMKITRSGYGVTSGKEWICSSGCTTASKVYSQSTVYQASDFCDASNGDCTVVLKVNWYKISSSSSSSSTSSGTIGACGACSKNSDCISGVCGNYCATGKCCAHIRSNGVYESCN